jgi:lysophospholipase L1-like esterase
MSVSILRSAWQAMRNISGFLTNSLSHEEAKRVPQMNALASEQIRRSTQNLTVAGAFAMALSEDRNPASLLGVEKCYYSPPNFERVTWVERDIPTPFVGFAPAPGPLASALINRMQFRYAREIDGPKPNNVCRIFLTGGSTAFGSGASSNDTTIGGYLEAQLNEVLRFRGTSCEVITAAAGAWGSTHERILVENRLVELEPDIVISLSGHNDAFWSVLGHNTLWFRAFQDDYFLVLLNAVLAANSAEQFPSQAPDPAMPVSAAKAAERLARNVECCHYVLRKVGADYVYALQPVLELSRKVRTPREQQIVQAVGSHSWFIQMPDYYREFSAALQALEQPDLHFLDATGIFDSYNDDTEFFIDTAHFGDRGNDLIAQYLRGKVLPIILRRLLIRSGGENINVNG